MPVWLAMPTSCLGLVPQAKLSLEQPPSSSPAPGDKWMSRDHQMGCWARGEKTRASATAYSAPSDNPPLPGVQSRSVLGTESAFAEPTPGRHWA